MARFDFQSPGAGFTEQITGMLAQRKADERQRMLDQLNVNADVRAQEVTQRQAQESEARMAEAAQRQELDRLGFLSQQMDADQDPTEMGVNPQDVELMKKWGMLRQLPTPQVSTSTEVSAPEGAEGVETSGPIVDATPPAPEKWGYVGTPQQRERKRLQGQSATFIASMMNDPKKAQVGKFLADFAAANDGIVPAEVMAQYMGPGPQIVMFDENSGRFTDTQGRPIDQSAIGPNAKIIQRGYKPRDYQPKNPFFMGLNEKGEPVFSIAEDPTQRIVGSGLARPTGGSGSSAANNKYGALGIPATNQEQLSLAEGALRQNPTDEAAIGQYRSLFNRLAVANNGKIGSPIVKQIMQAYMHNPTVADQMLSTANLTEKDEQDLQLMLGAIPDDVKQILKNNPFVPEGEQEQSGGFRGWVNDLVRNMMQGKNYNNEEQ